MSLAFVGSMISAITSVCLTLTPEGIVLQRFLEGMFGF